MLDLVKAIMPSAVEVEGIFYPIQTDFRYWLRFQQMWNESGNHIYPEFNFLYLNKKPKDLAKGFEALSKFYNPPRLLPRSTGHEDGTKVLDYYQDAELIYAAFFEVYHIDLIDSSVCLHWHKFLALLSGLHGTKLNDVMGYRMFNPSEKSDYKKTMTALKRAWSLEETYTEEEQAEIDKFNSLLKK